MSAIAAIAIINAALAVVNRAMGMGYWVLNLFATLICLIAATTI